MASISEDTTIKELQAFINEVYGLPNDRHFELSEMLNNIQRFAMRGIKGIRKNNVERTKKNLIISFSWLLSTLNRLHINLEEETWKRFPYLCSYCGAMPCECKDKKVQKRVYITDIDDSKRPKTLNEFQKMFNDIYPSSTRTLEHAGVHLAEEIGEFSEALMAYRNEKEDSDFKRILVEAADYFSCLVGVFNSLNVDLASEIADLYSDNCHECHNSPCSCDYSYIKNYKTKD
jgi:NTP pyrophosphatase (non-canonical NTP hydrolase)